MPYHPNPIKATIPFDRGYYSPGTNGNQNQGKPKLVFFFYLSFFRPCSHYAVNGDSSLHSLRMGDKEKERKGEYRDRMVIGSFLYGPARIVLLFSFVLLRLGPPSPLLHDTSWIPLLEIPGTILLVSKNWGLGCPLGEWMQRLDRPTLFPFRRKSLCSSFILIIMIILRRERIYALLLSCSLLLCLIRTGVNLWRH